MINTKTSVEAIKPPTAAYDSTKYGVTHTNAPANTRNPTRYLQSIDKLFINYEYIEQIVFNFKYTYEQFLSNQDLLNFLQLLQPLIMQLQFYIHLFFFVLIYFSFMKKN